MLPDLELPVGGRPEREVHPEVPVSGVLAEDPGRRLEHRDALVVPRPPDVGEMTLEPRRPSHRLEVGGPTVGALAPVVEDAGVEDRVHAQLRELAPQPQERRVVGVPAGGYYLAGPS